MHNVLSYRYKYASDSQGLVSGSKHEELSDLAVHDLMAYDLQRPDLADGIATERRYQTTSALVKAGSNFADEPHRAGFTSIYRMVSAILDSRGDSQIDWRRLTNASIEVALLSQGKNWSFRTLSLFTMQRYYGEPIDEQTAVLWETIAPKKLVVDVATVTDLAAAPALARAAADKPAGNSEAATLTQLSTTQTSLNLINRLGLGGLLQFSLARRIAAIFISIVVASPLETHQMFTDSTAFKTGHTTFGRLRQVGLTLVQISPTFALVLGVALLGEQVMSARGVGLLVLNVIAAPYIAHAAINALAIVTDRSDTLQQIEFLTLAGDVAQTLRTETNLAKRVESLQRVPTARGLLLQRAVNAQPAARTLGVEDFGASGKTGRNLALDALAGVSSSDRSQAASLVGWASVLSGHERVISSHVAAPGANANRGFSLEVQFVPNDVTQANAFLSQLDRQPRSANQRVYAVVPDGSALLPDGVQQQQRNSGVTVLSRSELERQIAHQNASELAQSVFGSADKNIQFGISAVLSPTAAALSASLIEALRQLQSQQGQGALLAFELGLLLNDRIVAISFEQLEQSIQIARVIATQA